MASPKLGTLVTLKATEVWANEPQVFTPWLAENLSLLGEALQLGQLELKGTEVAAGDFQLDILAEDEEGNAVLIENQFGKTDHKHLGQLISYVASQGKRATIVWVAEKFKEDHRAAIDWLNASTIEDFDFFGVEIEALKIGDSDPAPFFNVVAKPNAWARSIGSAAREAASSRADQLYQEYWLALREFFQQAGETRRFPKPLPRQWLIFPVGRSGFQLTAVLYSKLHRVRFELYMHQTGLLPKEAFHQLEIQREEIEAEIGYTLDWQELPDSVASRIAVHLDNAETQNRDDWPRQHQWILDTYRTFRRVFMPRVKSLNLSIGDEDDDIETT